MKVIELKSEIIATINYHREQGETIGFVPTMGALHDGHISLMKRANCENDISVVSIFVNPTQFNDKRDLEKYPRTLEADLSLLHSINIDYVFVPSDKEIYPVPDTRVFDFGMLDKVMEGKHRPGHFNGVAQVVSKLFDIVNPHKAYFGQKDFQQLAIIRKLVKILSLNIEIIPCPIIRENDGLAMSSRNVLLTPECRSSAPLIYQTLTEARNKMNSCSVNNLIEWVKGAVNSNPNLDVEYFELVDAETLEAVNDWESQKSIVGCIAVHAGTVRLIDNLIFK